jgi:hypothetical protein
VAELQLDADLRLRVTSPAGESASGVITADGSALRVDVDRPDVLFASVNHADVGRVADLLAATGISVHVVGPDGPAAVIGAGTSSRLGKAVTGSASVSPSPRAAARLVLTQPAVRVAALAVPIALIALVVRRLLRS